MTETMTHLEWLFVREYCKDFNGTQAYLRTFKTENASTAGTESCKLLKKPQIAAAVESHKQDCAAAAMLTPEWVLRYCMDILETDANDLSQVRRVCCRHCWGIAHGYQWTQAEYTEQVKQAVTNGRAVPDGLGGFGYDPHARPHDECPECGGQGKERVHINDTRELKGRALRSFNGVEKTKDGLKLKVFDRSYAMGVVTDFLGLRKSTQLHGLTDDTVKGLADFYGDQTDGKT